MTPADFAALVERLEERAIEANRCGAVSNQADTKAQLALLTALRATRAALVESFDILRGVEMSKASLESALTKARSALSAYPLGATDKGA